MKKVLVIFALVIYVASMISCARGVTPYEAANGKARCGRYLR